MAVSSTYPFFYSLNFYQNLEISIYRPYACHVMRADLNYWKSLGNDVKLTHIIGFTWEKASFCGKKNWSLFIRSKIDLSMCIDDARKSINRTMNVIRYFAHANFSCTCIFTSLESKKGHGWELWKWLKMHNRFSTLKIMLIVGLGKFQLHILMFLSSVNIKWH